MTDDRLAELEGIAAAATPGPWHDLTDDWNDAQDRFFKRRGIHWHGALRGSRGKHPAKRCYALIAAEPGHRGYHGRSLPDAVRASERELYPDWYDFTKVVGVAADEYRWTGGARSVGQTVEGLCGLERGAADRALIAAARTAVPELVAEVRRLRAENAALRGAAGAS